MLEQSEGGEIEGAKETLFFFFSTMKPVGCIYFSEPGRSLNLTLLSQRLFPRFCEILWSSLLKIPPAGKLRNPFSSLRNSLPVSSRLFYPLGCPLDSIRNTSGQHSLSCGPIRCMETLAYSFQHIQRAQYNLTIVTAFCSTTRRFNLLFLGFSGSSQTLIYCVPEM